MPTYPYSVTIGSAGGRILISNVIEIIFPAGFFRENCTVTINTPEVPPTQYRTVFASNAFPVTFSGGNPDYTKHFRVNIEFDSAFQSVRSKLRVCGNGTVGDWDPGTWTPAPTHIDDGTLYELGGDGFTRPLRFAVVKKIP